MTPARQRIATYGAAGLAVLGFVCLLVFALLRLAETERATRDHVSDNMLWVLTRAQSASLYLSREVSRRRAGEAADTGELRRRLDILISRLNLLEDGPQRRHLADLGRDAEIAALGGAVRAAEDVILAVGPGTTAAAERAHAVLAPLTAALGRAANESMTAEWNRTGTRLERQHAAIVQVIVSCFALLLLGLSIGYALYRSGLRTLRAQQALAREAELRAVYRRFVALVSHQFRSPLATVDSSMQRILRRGPNMPRDEIAGRAQRVRDVVADLTDLAETTLEGLRGGIEGAVLRRDEVSPQDLVAAAVAGLRRTAPERRFEVTYAPDLPHQVSTDPVLTRQILDNLLSNAHKFSAPSEPIRVDVLADAGLVIRVTDAGPVATPEGARAVSSPRDAGVAARPLHPAGTDFAPRTAEANGATPLAARTPPPGSADGPDGPERRGAIAGMGLGLTLSADIATMLGGSLSTGAPGPAGTQFTLRLPYTAPA